MLQNTSLPTKPLTAAAALEGMANTVLLIAEWPSLATTTAETPATSP